MFRTQTAQNFNEVGALGSPANHQSDRVNVRSLIGQTWGWPLTIMISFD